MSKNSENKKKRKPEDELAEFLDALLHLSTSSITKLEKIDKTLEDTSDSLNVSIDKLKKFQD